MAAILRTPRRQHNQSPTLAIALSIEVLESRTLPEMTPFVGSLSPIVQPPRNDTIDQARSLGDLSIIRQVGITGTVGRPGVGAADVDWYRFTLDRPSTVTFATMPGRPGNSLVSVLSLYGFSTADGTRLPSPTGYRLIVQDDGANHDGNARLARTLAAGTYFVAVSGAGNRYFHPLIAASGYPSRMGEYELVVTAADLDLRATDGPVVLAADPAAASDLTSSPLVLRIDLSTALNADSVRGGNTVQLRASATDGTSAAVPLASVDFDAAANELRITPAGPLRPGTYEVFLAGNRNGGQPVLVDQAGNPLGKSNLHPFGDDYTFSFRVSGSKGNRAPGAGADDTPATAQNLGELIGAGLVQVAGAIGNDPSNPLPFNPSDVDLYHFHIQGGGRAAFTAEVFAGRIGSSLDPALSLFRLDPSDRQLHFVASNDNSFNPTRTHDGSSEPLFTDPVLEAGLTAGDYYLAVSASANVPMPAFGRFAGTGGIFDPALSHSGKNGSTIGNYVLNVAAEVMNDPPHVSAVPTLDGVPLYQGTVLTAPPMSLSLTFDTSVNLLQLVRQTGQSQVDAIYIQSSQGGTFFPHLTGYSEDGRRAALVMRDALSNGSYQLHLSGRLGLTDGAGNPLAGNDPSGDYIVTFAVRGPARGSNGNPRIWMDEESDDDPAHPDDVGRLFPGELQSGVVFERTSPVAGPSDTADYYRFMILQPSLFTLGLTSSLVPTGIGMSLTDLSGRPIPLAQGRTGGSLHAAIKLEPGSYLISVSGWSPALAGKVSYQLSLLGITQEQAPPLATGPGPAIRIRPLTGGSSALLEASGPVAPSAGAAPASGGPHQGVIPSGVFRLLAAGPVGGSADSFPSPPTSDVYATILARTPDVLLSQAIASLPFLLAPPHSGVEQSTGEQGGFLPWLRSVLQTWEKSSWFQALELLYGSGAWQEKLRLGPVNGRFEGNPEGTVGEDEGAEPMSAAGEAWNGAERWTESLVPAWAATMALALLAARQPHRRPSWQ